MAAAIGVTAAGVLRDARPAAADHVQMIVSLSNTEPTPAPVTLSLYPGGPPLTLYVWAKDAHDPTGVAAFNIGFEYASNFVSVTSVQLDTAWLASTGRLVMCPPTRIDPSPETGVGRVIAGCSTVMGPAGVQGTGLLGSVTLQAGAASGFPILAFPPQTFLVNRGTRLGTIVPPVIIPSTAPVFQLVIARCADYNSDGFVAVTDVLNSARRFGARPGSPNWNAIFDLNVNNMVDVNDTLLSGRQFGRHCRI